jgi:hypothetical protein
MSKNAKVAKSIPEQILATSLLPREARRASIHAQDSDDLRGFADWIGQMANCNVDDRQLQKWHLQLGNSSRP